MRLNSVSMNFNLKDFFRRRSLKRLGGIEKSRYVQLGDITSAIFFVSVGSVKDLPQVRKIEAMFIQKGIDCTAVIVLNPKSGTADYSDEGKCCNETIIHKESLNWYGKPSPDSLGDIAVKKYNLALSLNRENDFTVEFLSNEVKADMKIGMSRGKYASYDIVIRDSSDAPLGMEEFLNEMFRILQLFAPGSSQK